MGRARRLTIYLGSFCAWPDNGRTVCPLTSANQSSDDARTTRGPRWSAGPPAGHNPGSRRPIPIIVNMKDHDIRVPIFGMGREVAISRRIRILFQTTTNRHDLPRTVLLAPLLDQINCVRKPADEGRVDHCGCPCLATARPVAVARRSGVRLKAGPDFLQHINEPGHFVGPDPTVQG